MKKEKRTNKLGVLAKQDIVQNCESCPEIIWVGGSIDRHTPQSLLRRSLQWLKISVSDDEHGSLNTRRLQQPLGMRQLRARYTAQITHTMVPTLNLVWIHFCGGQGIWIQFRFKLSFFFFFFGVGWGIWIQYCLSLRRWSSLNGFN